MLQGLAVEKLHGDEGLAIFFADVVNGADVGMVQCGSGLGFALKAGERLRVAGNFIGKELEGDETMKPRVFGFVDDAHAAAAQFLDECGNARWFGRSSGANLTCAKSQVNVAAT